MRAWRRLSPERARADPPPLSPLAAAHRLRSIIDYDYVLCLGAGKVLEFGTPKELIEKGAGELFAAVEASSDRDELREMAGVAAGAM